MLIYQIENERAGRLYFGFGYACHSLLSLRNIYGYNTVSGRMRNTDSKNGVYTYNSHVHIFKIKEENIISLS